MLQGSLGFAVEPKKKSPMEDLTSDFIKASSSRIIALENSVQTIASNMQSMTTTMQSLVSTIVSHEKATLDTMMLRWNRW